MSKTLVQALSAATLRILRPLVRVLLRNGISYKTFADLAKWVYVDVATRDFGLPGRKQSVSRVSVITGLSRKEVSRVQDLPRPDDAAEEERYNRAARVIHNINVISFVRHFLLVEKRQILVIVGDQ